MPEASSSSPPIVQTGPKGSKASKATHDVTVTPDSKLPGKTTERTELQAERLWLGHHRLYLLGHLRCCSLGPDVGLTVLT